MTALDAPLFDVVTKRPLPIVSLGWKVSVASGVALLLLAYVGASVSGQTVC